MKRAIGIGVAAAVLAGCANLATKVLPSNNQVFDPATLRGGAYRLDPEHAALLFEVSHLGFSGYVGRFNQMAASLDFDPAAPEAAVLDVQIATASVDTPSDVLDGKLRGPDMFEAEKYPVIRFQSRRVAKTGDKTGTMTGDLTMNGVTKPVTLAITFNGGAANAFTGKYTLGFAATGTLDRRDWGLTTWRPAIGDVVTLTIRAEFQKT